MTISDLLNIEFSLSYHERMQWNSLLCASIGLDTTVLKEDSLRNLLVVLFAYFKNNQPNSDTSVIAYGAGNIANEILPHIIGKINVLEIWDAYSSSCSLFGIPIVKPHFDTAALDADIVILIENSAIRYDVSTHLKSEGYKRIYSYKEYVALLEADCCFPHIGDIVTDETRHVFFDLIDRYDVLDDREPQVCYSVIPKSYSFEMIRLGYEDVKATDLCKRLCMLLKTSEESIIYNNKLMSRFIEAKYDNAFAFAYQLEVLLRNILANGVKTKERPIRMHNDKPYDQFAVYASVREIVWFVCGNLSNALKAMNLLRMLSPNSIPLISVECYFLSKADQLEAALLISRDAIKIEPNSLLANETFYNIATLCNVSGIPVPEPLPNYDLKERFCWSGLTFALCSGFDSSSGEAMFLPCFRTMQCAASPEGDFWDGEEWVDFRKSILDGSFKYCQKNHCSNIAAGWLPKKTECKIEDVKRIIDGDFSMPSPLEELHLSYDFHCNMKCNSCRVDYRLNRKEQNAEIDMLFEKNLRKLLVETKHLCLSGCGEAILSPHSKNILKSLSKKKYPSLVVELRTNVFSFNKKTWDALGSGREVIKHIAASIDASTKELFEKLRYPAKWDVVLGNLTFIQELRNSNEIDLFEFHVVVQTENIDELADILKMAIRYDADAITFSRFVNWRGLSKEEYNSANPFQIDHPDHNRLLTAIDEILAIREDIEKGVYALSAQTKKKIYINMHCVSDPNPSYDTIRYGRLKIR